MKRNNNVHLDKPQARGISHTVATAVLNNLSFFFVLFFSIFRAYSRQCDISSSSFLEDCAQGFGLYLLYNLKKAKTRWQFRAVVNSGWYF